eukprot:2797785-Pleurochrysis_carterae.AAC.1
MLRVFQKFDIQLRRTVKLGGSELEREEERADGQIDAEAERIARGGHEGPDDHCWVEAEVVDHERQHRAQRVGQRAQRGDAGSHGEADVAGGRLERDGCERAPWDLVLLAQCANHSRDSLPARVAGLTDQQRHEVGQLELALRVCKRKAGRRVRKGCRHPNPALLYVHRLSRRTVATLKRRTCP